MKRVGKLFVISASSGAGKTTLVRELCIRINGRHRVERVVTYTSKQPRPGEQDGQDYHFLSKKLFERKIREGFFIEWSTAYGNYYGSPRYVLDEALEGASFVVVVDRDGARAIAQECKNAVLIWVYPQDLETLRERLHARNTESADEIARRLSIAKKELIDEQANQLYQYRVLNDRFELAVKRLESIIEKELSF